MKIQKRENFSLLFVQRVDKVLNFLYNKGGKDRKLHKLCRRYAVCFRYFCDVSYPQLRELKERDQQPREQAERDVSYPQLRELKANNATSKQEDSRCILPAAAGIESGCVLPTIPPRRHVSYPQLRELKGAEPMFQYVLDDVSYPQLRELKLNIYGYAACYAECILPAAAGIETGLQTLN